MLQAGPQYGSAPSGYTNYGYGNGVPSQLPASSSMNSSMVPSTPLQLPGEFDQVLEAKDITR
jgi:protein SOK2